MSITVSIVEDNDQLRATLARVLARAEGFRFLNQYPSAEEALKALPTEPPDVVLMDINLPGMNGFEALKVLRSDPATSQIPVVALTANALPRDRARGLKAGFFTYMTKPIKVNEFMQVLDGALAFAGDEAARRR